MPNVLITGGSRGIGCAAVRMFAARGYRVAFTYLHAEEEATALAAETGACALCADVSDRAQITAAAATATEQLGGIDVLVNNAGIAEFKLFTDIDDASWSRMIGVNLSGVFYTTQAVLPEMIRRKSGCIINVSSIWGVSGASCEVHYSAAKAGVIGMSRALAQEVGPSGIRVNCIAPGVIDTDMNRALDADALASLREDTALCRIGKPEEVASLMLFLASDEAAMITGQCISVDGGIRM